MKTLNAEMVQPAEVKQQQAAGAPVVLVCAYDDQANFERIKIPGSMSYPEFQEKVPQLAASDVVFYCDCPHDELAKEKTSLHRQQGMQASVLEGGINAWKGQA